MYKCNNDSIFIETNNNEDSQSFDQILNLWIKKISTTRSEGKMEVSRFICRRIALLI